jgi:hypothetical protein
MNFDERYKYYTNGFLNKNKYFVIPDSWKNHRQNQPVFFNFDNDYFEILNKKQGSYLVVCDDGYNNYGVPCFQKTRKINKPGFSILNKKFQYARHWGYHENKDKKRWEEKKNEIIWRGVPTGTVNDRIEFCEKYHNTHNVGLTCFFNHQKKNGKEYLLKDTIDLNEFYEYKYIISIEGNDKDSGINWKLNSNSLVIMKPPTVESWLMEGKLIPWVHYVPLNDNLSNLDEIYNWCLNNDDKCKEIVKNANNFMGQFDDLENEKKLINKIELDYFKNVSFIFWKNNDLILKDDLSNIDEIYKWYLNNDKNTYDLLCHSI